MLKIENTDVIGWEHAIRGMRNPKNSWEKSDSGVCATHGPAHCADCVYTDCHADDVEIGTKYILGPNDLKLMTTLRNAGTDHRKFMRMITVYLDITAPLYWWKEFDTYTVRTIIETGLKVQLLTRTRIPGIKYGRLLLIFSSLPSKC